MAAILIVERGYSRRLGYLIAKRDRVSISSLHETYVGDPDDPEAVAINRVRHIDTKLQKGDIFTKPLETERHWQLSRSIGLFPIELSDMRRSREEAASMKQKGKSKK
jgi:hypothetical protein